MAAALPSTQDELPDGKGADMKFPMCADVLINLFGTFTLPEIWKEEWEETLELYRGDADFVGLMTFVAKKLNFAAKSRDSGVVKHCFPDSCPPEHLGLIMSPDNRTDWTRAVWLIYSEIFPEGDPGEGPFRFSKWILNSMENKLFFEKNDFRHLRKPRSPPSDEEDDDPDEEGPSKKSRLDRSPSPDVDEGSGREMSPDHKKIRLEEMATLLERWGVY